MRDNLAQATERSLFTKIHFLKKYEKVLDNYKYLVV